MILCIGHTERHHKTNDMSFMVLQDEAFMGGVNYLIKDAEADMGSDDRSNESVTDIRIEAGKITELGPGLSARPIDEIIDASNAVVYPGLINIHHHLDQSIMKDVSAGIDQDLDHWLELVPYRYWMHITPELMHKAALIGLSE